VYALSALAVVVLDQLTKLLVRSFLPYHSSITLLPKVLNLTHTYNTGAGFSIFTNQNILLIFAVIGIIGAMLYYFDRFKESEKIFASIIIGGALGNLIDRILLGHVVDFIDTGFWPVFNVADSAVTLGVCGLLYLAFKK
jgi:signal peptidase II